AAAGLGDDDDVAGDLDATTESGVPAAHDDDDATGRNPRLSDDIDLETAATSESPSLDEATEENAALRHVVDDTAPDIDASLLDATGMTQVLSDDAGVTIGDDDKTLLARVDDDEEYVATAALSDRDLDSDFDFAKTEALDKSAFDKDATGEMPRFSGD